MISAVSITQAVVLAWDSLRGSRLRAFLTLLGVILSTATLVLVSAAGHGMKIYVARELSDLGAASFRVRRMVMLGKVGPREYAHLLRKNPELNREEFLFLEHHVFLCSEIGLETRTGTLVRAGDHEDQWTDLRGVTSNIAVIAGIEPSEGRFISDLDNSRRAPVAFLGADVRARLFSGGAAVGNTVGLYGRHFEVVGVARARGSAFGWSQDNFVMIPVETALALRRNSPDISYMATTIGRQYMEEAQDEVRMLLRSYRHLRPDQSDNFGLVSAEMISRLWDDITGVTAEVVLIVICVFLTVSGIVLMNTMLAIVSERTREIGIRKSAGATKTDILTQFLAEAVFLSGVGGLFGVLCGWCLAVLVRSTTPLRTVVPFSAVVLSIAVSVILGLLFGVFPACRAARLDPIEAMRAEQ